MRASNNLRARSLSWSIQKKPISKFSRLISIFEAVDLGKNRLHLVKRLRMLSERKLPFLYIADQFFELLDSQFSTNENLHAARIADKIRFVVLVCSLIQLFAA